MKGRNVILKKYLSTIFFVLVFLAIVVFFNNASATGGGIERSGRWFKYNGNYLYFVGYDLQELFAKKSYSYADMDYMLNQIQEFRINKVRVWLNPWFMGINAYYPWAVDTNGKINLDVWDITYWTRMKDFIQKCKDRDIIVEVTLFAPYPKGTGPDSWWNNIKWKLAWNKSFNSNNAFSTNANGHFWPQFFDLNLSEKSSSGKTLKDYQKALIDKSIDELKRYGNVYFEVANEFPGVWDNGNAVNQVYPWQQYWADYMHNAKGVITTCQANEGSGMNTWGIDYVKDKSSCDILNFHFRTSGNTNNADQISNFLHNLQKKGKILQSNESRTYESPAYTDINTREAWGTFTSGAYYFHYQDTPDIIGDSAWRNRSERLKTLRNIAESVTFWQMSPVDASGNEYDSLVTEGPGSYWQILSKPGKEYVVYFSINPSSIATKINLQSGTYSYRYYDTRIWNTNGIMSGSINSSGGFNSIPAPSISSWNGSTGIVLVIKKQSTSRAYSSRI